jgi:phage terminase small subunit
MVDLNAAAAARRAGFSEKTAIEQGYQLMQKPQIRSKIEELQKAFSKKLDITAERVLLEYARMAFVDPKDFYDEKGELLKVPDMPEDARRALSSFDVHIDFMEGVETGETKKVKWEKKAALDSLAKHLGLFKDVREIKGVLTLEQLIGGSLENDD